MTVLLRPRHFFTKNPALDVPPSYSSWPSQIAAGAKPYVAKDATSRSAFGAGCSK